MLARWQQMLMQVVAVMGIVFMAAGVTLPAMAAQTHQYDRFHQQWHMMDVDTLLRRGLEASLRHEADSALMFYRVIISQIDPDADERHQRAYATAYINQGAIFQKKNDNQRAYESFMKAGDIVKRFGFEWLSPYVYANIGSIYQDLHEYKTTMSYNQRALNQAIVNKDWNLTSTIAENMFFYILEHDDLETYEPVLTQLEQAGIPTDNEYGQMTMAYTRAMRLVQRDSLAQAVTVLDQVNKMVDECTYVQPEIYQLIVMLSKSMIEQRMGRLDAAIATGKQCEQLGLQYGISDNKMLDVYLLIARLYRQAGQVDSAFVYWDKYTAAEAMSGDTTLRAERIRSMRSLYDLNVKDEEITRAHERNRQHIIVLLIVTLFSLVVLGLLLYLYRQKRALDRQHQELYRRNADIMKQGEVERRQLQRYQERIMEQERELDRLNAASQAADTQPSSENKYASSSLDETMKIDLLNRVRDVMETSNEIFSPDFTVNRLADLTDSNAKYISQVINEFYQKNFSTFLNEFRIHEACKKLSDPNQRGQYTVEAISASVGFKSRSGFTTVFKKSDRFDTI